MGFTKALAVACILVGALEGASAVTQLAEGSPRTTSGEAVVLVKPFDGFPSASMSILHSRVLQVSGRQGVGVVVEEFTNHKCDRGRPLKEATCRTGECRLTIRPEGQYCVRITDQATCSVTTSFSLAVPMLICLPLLATIFSNSLVPNAITWHLFHFYLVTEMIHLLSSAFLNAHTPEALWVRQLRLDPQVTYMVLVAISHLGCWFNARGEGWINQEGAGLYCSLSAVSLASFLELPSWVSLIALVGAVVWRSRLLPPPIPDNLPDTQGSAVRISVKEFEEQGRTDPGCYTRQRVDEVLDTCARIPQQRRRQLFSQYGYNKVEFGAEEQRPQFWEWLQGLQGSRSE